MKPTIAVDYDNTIVDFAFPKSGPPKKDVREALSLFQRLGYHILIYSCRTCKWYPEIFSPGEELDMNRAVVRDMVDTLNKWSIPYDEIDDGTKGKPVADFYIDDKGVRFHNWNDAATFVMRNTPFEQVLEHLDTK